MLLANWPWSVSNITAQLYLVVLIARLV